MMKLRLVLITIIFSTSLFSQETINGAGSTFINPILSKWIDEYKNINPKTKLNYQSIGSGGGIRQIIRGTIDFGASDVPMNEQEKSKLKFDLMHVPVTIGAISVAFNLDETDKLKLDGPTLVQIFMGKINKWNDPAIKKLNPDTELPDSSILVVHRSDGSGTTGVFTSYLANVSETWKKSVGAGKAVSWPAGIGGKGNEGVTNMVKQTPGAIGYIELAYAMENKLNSVALKNAEDKFVKPTLKRVSNAAVTIKDSDDFTVSLINLKGDVYPISSFSYLLIPLKKENKKIQSLKKFIEWVLGDGQKFSEKLHYAPLPKTFSKKVVKKLNKSL